MAGTLPVTAQSPSETSRLRALPDLLDLVHVLLRADRAFDQRDVDILGKFLRIHQRAVHDIDLAGRER